MWAIVELMGHNSIAGEVLQSIDFPGLVQINVPQTENQHAFTKIVNPSAIYAINPATEETVRIKAEALASAPVFFYDVAQVLKERVFKPFELKERINDCAYDNPF